jgi:hypothetical protein
MADAEGTSSDGFASDDQPRGPYDRLGADLLALAPAMPTGDGRI